MIKTGYPSASLPGWLPHLPWVGIAGILIAAESRVYYLKYDNCFVENSPPMQTGYQAMRDALNTAIEESGHAIVFSMCSWAFNEWNLQTGQLWRTTGDIAAVFNGQLPAGSTSNTIVSIMLSLIHISEPTRPY